MAQEVESVFSIIGIPAKWIACSKDSIDVYSIELWTYRHYFVRVCTFLLPCQGLLFILRLTGQPHSVRKSFCQGEKNPVWEADTTYHVLPWLWHNSWKSLSFAVTPSLTYMLGIHHSVQDLVVSNDSWNHGTHSDG